MGRDAFLKLLLTQLKFQDPINPMQDKDFITQLAQFSSLEQLEDLGNGFDQMGQGQVTSQAVSLLGRDIDYVDPQTGQAASGKVSSIKFKSGYPILMIGDTEVSPSQVMTVK
jgi:flagellar basal-body rod modification protein FlgD